MATFDDLARRMDGFAADVEGPDNVRRVALLLLTGVTLGTPVDTGRARANWLVGVNAPRRQTEGATDPTGQATLAQGEQVIAAARGDDEVWLSNNLPYILKLNEGSSPQAPPGYIQDAIDASLDALNDFSLG